MLTIIESKSKISENHKGFINLHSGKKNFNFHYHEGYLFATWINAKNYPVLSMINPKAKIPAFIYYFKNENDLLKYYSERINEINERTEKIKNEKAANILYNAKDHFKIGDILNTSWGYEQTNVEFYQIIDITKNYLICKEVYQNRDPSKCGYDSAHVTPIKDDFTNDDLHKFFTKFKYNRVQISHPKSFISIGLWDGKPCYISWYY